MAEEWQLPVLIHLTKMDRERADFEADLAKLQKSLGREVVALQLPVGKEHDFTGVVDLLNDKLYRYEPDGDGKAKPQPIPDEMQDEVATWRERLIEAVAETDDALLEKYFEEGQSRRARSWRARCARAVLARKIVPVTMSSGTHGIGASALLDAIVELAPSPLDRGVFPATNIAGEPVEVKTSADEPTSALVFKTLSDPFTGKISLIRVVSGTVTTDSHLWNAREDADERTHNLMEIEGKQGRATPQLITGDIGGVAKLKHAHTGDTLADKNRPVQAGLDAEARGRDLLRHRAQVQGRRGEDRRGAASPDGGGHHAARSSRPGDRRVPALRDRPAARRDRGRQAQETVERRGHPAPAEGPLPRDDPQAGRRPRATQEADRRPRPVRRLPDQGRAADRRARSSSSSTRSSAARSRRATARRSRRASRRPAGAAISPATR